MQEHLIGFTDPFTGSRQDMLVSNNRVVYRGLPLDSSPVGYEVQSLLGKFLWPKYVDNHCHVIPTGLNLSKLNLRDCITSDEFLEAIRMRHKSHPDGWLVAVQYDQNRSGGDFLTRTDLDAISGTRPIYVTHANGHAGIANSAALRLAGIDETVKDPSGGKFRRDASGRLDGILLEMAHEQVLAASPQPTIAEMTQAVLDAGQHMASVGIGAATDMMTGAYDMLSELKAYGDAARQGCPVHLRLYLQWKHVFGPRAVAAGVLQEAIEALPRDRVKVCGIKIFADGAIASATAAIYGKYSGAEATGPRISRNANGAAEFSNREVSGQLIYSQDRLRKMVLTAHEAGFNVATHAIGDYAADLVMDAYESTGEPGRHRLEHAMILSDGQIERIAKARTRVTFQPEFMVRFGPAYQRQLGPERAARLERARSVLGAGIPLSFSSDQPIVTGDPMVGMRTAVNRPEGFDPAENVTPLEALTLYTSAAAEANGDGETMGSLNPGMWADYLVSESDPLRSL